MLALGGLAGAVLAIGAVIAGGISLQLRSTGCLQSNVVASGLRASDNPAEIAGGVWYQGCWSVTKDGAGYGADHLDLSFKKQGDVCP